VTGHGARRVLHYRISSQPGLGVRFAEVLARGRRPVNSALITRSRGTIRFTPALGLGTRRVLIAQTTRNGVPGASDTVGAYTPGTIKPGKASRIVVRHGRAGWRIAWRPGANATRQQLTVRFIDGAQVLLTASSTQRSLVLARRLDHGAQPTTIAIVALREPRGDRSRASSPGRAARVAEDRDPAPTLRR